MQVRVNNNKEFGSCGCGRSPTGECVGWHALPMQEYLEKLEDWKLLNELNSKENDNDTVG